MEDLVTPLCKDFTQSDAAGSAHPHVYSWCPQGVLEHPAVSKGVPALRDCKRALLIFSLAAKPQTTKKGKQPKLDDNWMIG